MRPISDASFVELDTIIFLLYKEIATNHLIFFFFCFLLLFLFFMLVKLKASMMQCTAAASGGFGGEMSVLDRQRARLRWQGMQGMEEEKVMMVTMPPSSEYQSFSDVHVNSMPPFQNFPAVKNDPGLDNGWPDFAGGFMPPAPFSGEHIVMSPAVFSGELGLSPAAESFASISRTTSCQPPVGINAAAKVVVPTEKALPPAKKRKGVEKAVISSRTMQMEDYKDKKVKGEVEDDEAELTPKQSDQTSINVSKKAAKKDASAHTSKENSKASEVQQKPDYIHVRARRGQATDSHSLAERVRREKISERMKYLQDLVPGCNKITGKAGMLDEIINYVQSLQRQVEFLSMKLASVNPRLDFNIDDFFAKEMFPASTELFPPMSMLPELSNQAFFHYHPLQPVVSCSGLNVATPAPERRAPASLPDGFLDTCFNASPSTNWDIDLHQLYNTDVHQGREPTFAPQQFQGDIQVNDLKVEM